MHPLPTLEYSNYDLKRATISRYSLVKFEGNFYSVPDTYRPRHITLKVLVDRIMFLDGNIPPTYDTLRFFLHLHQTTEQKVEPFAFQGGFEVTEPDLTAFDQMIGG